MPRPLLIYVHFPYCLAKCPYCDFVSYATERSAIDHAGYADAVLAEAHARRATFAGGEREVVSIFFGGGTPSLWHAAELGRVLYGLRALYDVPASAEVTVECNPTSLDAAQARALGEAGVTRLSIGTQSLRQEQLTFLGRLHDPAGAETAVAAALGTGLRVSTDLIFGLPDQAVSDAREQAATLAATGLRHLSCYQLTIEPGTRFGELARRGRLPRADDGRVAEAFLAIDDALSERGFTHYEISNYAQAGEESRHNLGYWRGAEYVGLGCGAYGFVRDGAGGFRYRNEVLPDKYVQSARSGGAAAVDQVAGVTTLSEPLDGEALLRERIMLGLRLKGGLDLDGAGEDLGLVARTPARARAIDKLVARGRLETGGSSLKMSREAWLFADDTAATLF